MNRLTAYFQNAKLAKLGCLQARENVSKYQYENATRSLTQGFEYLMAAMNCLTSIAFHQKPKRRKS